MYSAMRQTKLILIYVNNLIYNHLFFIFLKKNYLKYFNFCQIGKNSIILSKVKFYSIGNISIGNNTIVNPSVDLDNRCKIKIGNNVSIGKYCKIFTLGHNHHSRNFETIGKEVKIEDYVVLYPSVYVSPGVTIGKGAVVHANSTVTKNLSPFNVYGGNPAIFIKKRSTKHLKYKNFYDYWFPL